MSKTWGDLFLAPRDQDKLRLYQQIQAQAQETMTVAEWIRWQRLQKYPDFEINLRQLALLSKQSYGAVYYTYKQLRLLLRQLAPDVVGGDERLFCLPAGQVRLALVKAGVPFNFVQHLLAEDLADFEGFLTASSVSRSTALRQLRPLRDLAKQLGVSIVYEKMQISGPELNIRLFLYMAYWRATNGAGWPFANWTKAQAQQFSHQVAREFSVHYANPVIGEMQLYFVAVGHLRRIHHHFEAKPVAVMTQLTPNVLQSVSDLSDAQQAAESQLLYLIHFLVPSYSAPDDPLLANVLGKLQYFDPRIHAFVVQVIAQLPDDIILQDAQSHPVDALLEASIFATVISVLTVGVDFEAVNAYAYNQHMHTTPVDPALKQLVQHVVLQALAKQPSPELQQHAAAIAHAVYLHLLQLRRYTQPVARVKVAMLLEPVTLDFYNLLTFINRQPTVKLWHGDYHAADLVIEDSALPLQLTGAKRPIVFKWDINADSEQIGQLYSVILDIQQQKVHQAGGCRYDSGELPAADPYR